MEFLFITEGAGVLQCGARRFDVRPGDLAVIHASELHGLESASGGIAYDYVIADVRNLVGQDGATSFAKYVAPVVEGRVAFRNLVRGDPEPVSCLGRILDELERREPAYELELKALMSHLLVLLYRNHVEGVLSRSGQDVRRQNMRRLEDLFRYVESGYEGPITTAGCAAMLGMGVSPFCRLFRRMTGMTLSGYVNHYRVRKAEVLLRDTPLSVTEVAMAVGFSDAAYFTRAFTRIAGMPPTGYRKRAERPSKGEPAGPG